MCDGIDGPESGPKGVARVEYSRIRNSSTAASFRKFFFRKEFFFFFFKPLVLLLHLISTLSSKVKNTVSIHKYTQLVMLTHYSPL